MLLSQTKIEHRTPFERENSRTSNFTYEDDEEDDNYLSIPFVDNDENDEESINRRMSASRLSRFVGYGVVMTIVAAAIVALSLYIKSTTTPSVDDDFVETNLCYEAPSCQNVDPKQVYNPTTGFTNNTGFRSASLHDNSCCNICPAGVNQTVCFDVPSANLDGYRNLWGVDSSEGYSAVDKNCSEKTGQGDYDYILLDQMYYPQFCNALKEGHDPTLSHIAGTQCTEKVTNSTPVMNIHGFWPNYYHGFPQCCDTNFTKTDDPASVTPLNPYTVQTEWPVTYPLLQEFWYDPTTDEYNTDHISCSTCYLLNHEWQKHGSCFSPEEPQLYFASGLQVHVFLTNYTKQVVAMNGSVVQSTNISDLYLHRVNVQCDPLASIPTQVSLQLELPSTDGVDGIVAAPLTEVGVFMELQTCWKMVIVAVSVEDILRGRTRGDKAVAQVSVVYDKRTGGVLAHSEKEMRDLLSREATTDNIAALSERYGLMEVADFYWIDCVPSSPAQFSTPCPSKVFVGNYI